MRRLFTLFIMLMTLSAATWAASYNLWILGTQVTDDNKVNIKPNGLKAGTISYDSSSNILTLNGVTLTAPSGNTDIGIHCLINQVVDIKLVGSNKITTNSDVFYLASAKPINILGSGSFEGISTQGNGITIGASDMNVSIVTTNYFIMRGAKYGYKGVMGDDSGLLYMKKTSTDDYGYAFQGSEGAVYGVRNLSLDGMVISNSGSSNGMIYGCYFDDSQIKQNGGAIAKGYVAFKSIKLRTGLYIGNKEICVANSSLSYPIYVGSKYISSGGEKAVCFDPSTWTLTLTNATISCPTPSNPSMEYKDNTANLKVKVVGNSTIENTSTHTAFSANGNTIFNGSGMLTLKAKADCGMRVGNNAGVVVQDITLEASGSKYGLFVYNGTSETLSIQSGTVHAKAEQYGAIVGFKTITLGSGLGVAKPVGGQISGGKVVDASGNVAKEALITKVTDYGFKVDGINVTSANASDILGDGKVTYSPTGNKLTLNGANGGTEQAIFNENNSNLIIEVKGDVVLKSSAKPAIAIYKTSTICGSGNLTLESTGDCGLYAYLADLTIKDITMEASGTFGLAGRPSNENLKIENATIHAKGEYGAIWDFTSITLGSGLVVLKPAGGSISGGKVVDANGNMAKEVTIGKDESVKYELYVNDTQVTSGNAADILGDGKVVYDAEANELTLDGASLTGIQNKIPNLKVIVKGDNTIENNADNVILIDSYENITFEGDGTLNLKSTNKTSLGMRLAATYSGARSVLTMLLQGPAFNITAGQGLFGTGFNPILNIYYPSKLKYEPVEGGNANPISGFLGFNFSRLTMVEPEGAYYSTSNRYVQYNDARYTGPLVIDLETYKLWIAGTQVSEVNKDDILGDGVFSYVSWYKTLHIKGDYANTADCRIIDSNIEDLIISVDATSKLTTANDDYAVIYLKYNTEIQGMGALTLESVGPGQRNIAIYQEFGDKLTISNANIEVGDGFAYAITGEPNVALEVINSDIVAKAHYIGCFRDFGSMTLNGCYIDSPRGAVYTDGALVDADGHIIGSDVTYETVVIKRGADAVGGLATDAAPADVFDVAGRKLDTVGRGINIVRSADGRVRKVLKK